MSLIQNHFTYISTFVSYLSSTTHFLISYSKLSFFKQKDFNRKKKMERNVDFSLIFFFLLYPFTAWLLLNTIIFKTMQYGLEVCIHDIWYLDTISWKINVTCYRNKHCTFLYYRCLLNREQVYFRNLTFLLYRPFISRLIQWCIWLYNNFCFNIKLYFWFSSSFNFLRTGLETFYSYSVSVYI